MILQSVSPRCVAWQVMQQVGGQPKGHANSSPQLGAHMACALLLNLSPDDPPDVRWAQPQILTLPCLMRANVGVKR